jgi:predicted RNase H-like HicB family nuclease
MTLRIILEPTDEGGYTAIVPTLPGCISEGDTRGEALENIKEAIHLYLEEQAGKDVGDKVFARPSV